MTLLEFIEKVQAYCKKKGGKCGKAFIIKKWKMYYDLMINKEISREEMWELTKDEAKDFIKWQKKKNKNKESI